MPVPTVNVGISNIAAECRKVSTTLPTTSLALSMFYNNSPIVYAISSTKARAFIDGVFTNTPIGIGDFRGYVNGQAPGVPTIGIPTAIGNNSITVPFTPAVVVPGFAATSYKVTSSGGQVASTTSSPVTIAGLTNGVQYSFTVAAINAYNTSAVSSTSAIAYNPGISGAPISVSAVAGNTFATVSYVAPTFNGGAAITSYTATSSPGGFTASVSVTDGVPAPIIVIGLTNGVAYTFTVTATNSYGTGVASASSASVSPFVTTYVYPPVAITGETTIVTGQAYGNGTYVVTASSKNEYALRFVNTSVWNGWNVFDNSLGYDRWWMSAEARYSGGLGGPYIDSISTLVNGIPVLGEWVTFKFPQITKLTSYELYPRDLSGFAYENRNPNTWVVCGSIDNVSYTELDYQSRYQWVTQSKYVGNFASSNPGYIYYRTIVIAVGNADRTDHNMATLAEIKWYNTDALTIDVPAPPSNLIITYTSGSTATATFTSPTYVGGSAITSYTITATLITGAIITATGTGTTISISNLVVGGLYTFTVNATNLFGNGGISPASSTTIVTGPNTPNAPTPSTLTANGGNSITVAFTAAGSGTAATSYRVVSSPGNFTATNNASPITVTGLTNGVLYSFTIIGSNANGVGKTSASSGSIGNLILTVYPATPKLLFNAEDLALANNAAVSSWGVCTQATALNQPKFANISSLKYVDFTGGLYSAGADYMTGTTTSTMLYGTNGGFTINLLANFGAPPSSNMCVLQFETGTTSSRIFQLFYNADGYVGAVFYWNSNSYSTYSYVTPNVWRLITITFNASGYTTFYMNNVAVGGFQQTALVDANATGTVWLMTSNGASISISMKLQHMSVYDRLLSTAEITSIYTSKTSIIDTNYPVITAPTAPTNLSVSSLSTGTVTITFTAPSSNGGAPIAEYTATSTPSGLTGKINGGGGTSITVTGLTNGTSYTFIVVATNYIGSTSSSVSQEVIVGAPISPTLTTVTAVTATSASVAFIPASTGIVATSYTVTSYPGSLTGTGTSSPIVVEGLTSTTIYTFTIIALATTYASISSKSILYVYSAPAVLNFDASTAAVSVNSSLTTWVNTGSMGPTYSTIAVNSPKLRQTSGLNHVNFDRAYYQHFIIGMIDGSSLPLTWFNNGGVYAGFTIFIVSQFTGSASYNETLFGFSNGLANDNIFYARQENNSVMQLNTYNGTTSIVGTSLLTTFTEDNNFHIYAVTMTNSSSGSTYTAYRDSVTTASATFTTSTPLNNRTTFENYIGRGYYSFLNGNIRQILMFNSALDSTTMTKLYTALLNKWFPTVPDKPTSVTGIRGHKLVVVSFIEPVNGGGSPITSYTATSSPGGFTGTVLGSTASPITVSGLTNGTTYIFTVIATNKYGSSVASTASGNVIPAAVPSSPTNVTGVRGNTLVIVSFVTPVSNSGFAITGYTATSSPGGITGVVSGATASPITVSGLTNGLAYTFTVTATNATGLSPPSVASASVTPATLPGAPTGVSAVSGNASATVSFTTPVSNGGSVITGYTATSSPGGITGVVSGATASPITVSGLTNGLAYTFTVTATNAVGTSAVSTASTSVTPFIPATVPGAPTVDYITQVTSTSVSVVFTAPVSNGGSAITSYIATSIPGGITGTAAASPITVSELTSGTAYTFTVTATNAIGTSVASTVSGSTTAPLYAFTSNTFTTATSVGQNGPTLAMCRTAYSSQTWSANTNLFNVNAGVQKWRAPKSGTYMIVIRGARGGHARHISTTRGAGVLSSGGCGYGFKTTVNLTRGSEYSIVVGQSGYPDNDTVGYDIISGGGGGASWLIDSSYSSAFVVVAAGGGGGLYEEVALDATYGAYTGGGDAQSTTAPTGFAGDGYSGDGDPYGGHGCVFNGDFTTFVGGARGISNQPAYNSDGGAGGFGGGGGAGCQVNSVDGGSGGGGGYTNQSTGGQAAEKGRGGGSTSGLNAASEQTLNFGDGSVQITFVA